MCLTQTALAQTVDVTVTSGPTELADDLRRASLTVALLEDRSAKASDYIAAAQADYRQLLRALYEKGYYAGDLSILVNGREAALIAPFSIPGRINSVTISVASGPKFAFGRTQITPLPGDADITSDFAAGKPALASAVRDAAEDATKAWRAQGHAKARIDDSAVTADHRSSQLDVALTMAPGPRLSFGRLSVTGDSAVRRDRIHAIAGLPHGKTFDPEQVDLATKRLRRTGTFETVVFSEAKTWDADMSLPMSVDVSDRKPRRIGAGIEYATDAGTRISGYWLHRNLLGGAERLRVSAAVSNLGQGNRPPSYRLAAQFKRPATFGADNALNMSFSAQSDNTLQYRLKSFDAYAGISREVNQHFTLSAGIGVALASGNDGFGPRSYRLISLPITAADDRRDDAQDARRGYYISADLTPFWGAGGVGAGYRLATDLRAYQSFGADDRVTLAGRLQVGTLNGVSGAQAPTDFLFYSGGGGTVRGQPYQSLARPGSNGTLGGNSFVGLQTETRIRVGEKLGFVGFADAGHVGAGALPLANGAWHAGAGLGVRYDTAIGPIRLDVAVPITGADRFRRGQIYVGIGQAF